MLTANQPLRIATVQFSACPAQYGVQGDRLTPIRLFRLTVFQFRMLFQEFMLEVEGVPQSVFACVGVRYFLPVNFDPCVKDTVHFSLDDFCISNGRDQNLAESAVAATPRDARIVRSSSFSVSTIRKNKKPPSTSHGQIQSGMACVSNSTWSGGA